MLPKLHTISSAVGRWRDILLSLGVDAQFLQNRHGPCPLCGGKDRYRFHDLKGKGNWHCNQCGPGDGVQLLQALYGWDFKHTMDEIDRVIGTARLHIVKDERSVEDAVKAIKATLRGAFPVKNGDPVWNYLSRRCGITTIPNGLRFHPALYHKETDRKYPAMLAIMQYPNLDGASVHRTYLTQDGYKAPLDNAKKIMSGKPLNTSCVRLSAPAEVLGIAEGIETALAASVQFGLPVWAATTAGLMEKWEPPIEAREVVVFGDNDSSYTGQASAYLLAKRLTAQGLKVRVEIPKLVDTDFADPYHKQFTDNQVDN